MEKSRTEPREIRGFKKGKQIKYRGKNPAEAMVEAEEMVRKFHGRESREILDIEDIENYEDELAVLGQLLALNILDNKGNAYIPIVFGKMDGDNDKPIGKLENLIQVCSDAKGRQIYFQGGNQGLDLEKLSKKGLYQGEASFNKDWCVVGDVYSIEYFADKHHLTGPEKQKKGMAYEHQFGEEKDGEMPTLVYDTRNCKLLLSGGSYTVEETGIRN